jgi:hypothetical protein
MITAQGTRDTSYEEAGGCQFLHHIPGHYPFGTIRWCFKVAFPRERYFEDRGEIAAGPVRRSVDRHFSWLGSRYRHGS